MNYPRSIVAAAMAIALIVGAADPALAARHSRRHHRAAHRHVAHVASHAPFKASNMLGTQLHQESPVAPTHPTPPAPESRPAAAADLAISVGNRGAGPLEIAVLLTLLSLAPALLVMLTSFTRIVIVLSLLRQALGLQQTPPNIVITGLAMFLSMIVMAPTWTKIRTVAFDPYMAGQLAPAAAAEKAEAPLRVDRGQRPGGRDVSQPDGVELREVRQQHRRCVVAGADEPHRQPLLRRAARF